MKTILILKNLLPKLALVEIFSADVKFSKN
jgi:hypothetical protein